MKKYFNYLTCIVLASLTLNFAACKKDNPVREDDQEEFDGAKIHFTAGQLHDGEFLPEGEPIEVTYTKGNTNPTPSHIHLEAGKTYLMEMEFFAKGESVNSDFDAPHHQFFFIGAPEGILDYTYADDRIGLKGYLTINAITEEGFDWKIILRHGLDKSHTAAQTWNSPDYRQAGGTDDFNRSLEVHPVSAEEGHDH